MRIVIAALALVLAVGGLTSTASAKERLVVGKVPADTPWKVITNVSAEGHWLWEQVPADQTGDNHIDILVAQGFSKLAGADPVVFLHGMFGLAQRDCNAVRVNGPTPRVEDGHHVAYAQIYCGRAKGQSYGLSMLYKVISGADALYVVERELTTPGSDTPGVMSFDKAHAEEGLTLLKRTSAAVQFLDNSVFLCDDLATDARCKAPPAP